MILLNQIEDRRLAREGTENQDLLVTRGEERLVLLGFGRARRSKARKFLLYERCLCVRLEP